MLFGWVINPRRFRLVIALSVILLASAALVAFVVVSAQDASCQSQNKALSVLTYVLVKQADAPHRFNAPIDVARRKALLAAELHRIKEAKCH